MVDLICQNVNNAWLIFMNRFSMIHAKVPVDSLAKVDTDAKIHMWDQEIGNNQHCPERGQIDGSNQKSVMLE